ncbi:RHS repeat domain-containing protein [Natroniella sp. ANB-PHB2]|uniref:RHS repeat domain-containing protein n=1 Tax=Natroniella sp. ANB-PHB2 TaxID=3384444 RepID=UPI0038D478C1
MKHFHRPNQGNAWGRNRREPLRDVYFYHQDRLNSVRKTTGRNGEVVERYNYDAYGYPYQGRFEQNHRRSNPFGFTGKRHEVELGVHSFAYRHYNPRSMRWLTVDPIQDGLNWYQYVGGDPVNYVDPLGLFNVRVGESLIEHGLREKRKGNKIKIGSFEASAFNFKKKERGSGYEGELVKLKYTSNKEVGYSIVSLVGFETSKPTGREMDISIGGKAYFVEQTIGIKTFEDEKEEIYAEAIGYIGVGGTVSFDSVGNIKVSYAKGVGGGFGRKVIDKPKNNYEDEECEEG